MISLLIFQMLSVVCFNENQLAIEYNFRKHQRR